ncbi:MAG: hypothetical protein ACTSRP_22305 [Candidatus Helarchaeota archaeon]
MKENNNLIIYVFSYFSANFIITLIVIIFSFIIPRVLGPETYGIYKFLIFLPNIIITYAPEADFAMNRFIPYYLEHNPESIIPMIKWNLKIKSIGAIGGIIILIIYFLLAAQNYISYLLFLIPIFLLNFFTPTFSKVLYGFKKVKQLNLISIFYQILYFPIFLILFLFINLFGAFFGILTCSIVRFILYLYYGKKLLVNLPKHNSNFSKKELIMYNFPFYIGKRINTLSFTYASFFIAYKFGIGEEIGFYLLAIFILNILIQFGKSVRTANFPLLIQKYEENIEEYRKIIIDSLRYSYLITSTIVIIILLFGKSIFIFILGAEYLNMIPLIEMIMIYLIFWSMLNVFFDISLTQNKTWPNIVCSSLVSSISIILYILSPSYFGVYEILFIYLLAQVIGNIFLGIYGIKKSKLVLKNYLKLLGKMIICIIVPLIIFLLNSIYLCSYFHFNYVLSSLGMIIYIILIFISGMINKNDFKIFLTIFNKK